MNRQPIMLVAWQDSDVTDLIKDKSFSGKLKASSKHKHNIATRTITLKRFKIVFKSLRLSR